MPTDRRQFLLTAGSLGTIAVAGCSQGNGQQPDEEEDVEDLQRVGEYTLSSSSPMEIYEPRTENDLADVHWHTDEGWGHWHSGPLEVPLDRWESYELRVNKNTRDLEPIPVSEDEDLAVAIDRTEKTSEGLFSLERTNLFINLRGEREGEGALIFQLLYEGETAWTSPELPIEVSDEF